MAVLDALDKKILAEFDRNSRRSLSAVARVLKQSRERIEYRTQRLIDEGVIKYFGTTFNPQRLGFQIYKTFLRTETNLSKLAELNRHLEQHPRIAWLARCEGEWDIVFCLYARTADEFHAMHTTLLSDFNPVVLNFSSYCLTNVKMYERGYLQRATEKGFRPLAGGFSPVELSALDWKVMQKLHREARLPTVEIARLLRVSNPSVAASIARLEELGIITGYGVTLDSEKLGTLFFKAQFYLRDYSADLRERFEAFCDSHPEVTCYTEQIGDCNLEVELHVDEHSKYFKLIEEIRIEFTRLIRNFKTIIIQHADYWWLPRVP